MIVTKEKVVAALALALSLSGILGVRRPTTAAAIEIPPEEAARPSAVSAVPPLRPERPWDGTGRDPFVPSSAWEDAVPAKIPSPPPIPIGRAWPAGSLPGGPRAPYVVVPRDPDAVNEPDPGKGGE